MNVEDQFITSQTEEQNLLIDSLKNFIEKEIKPRVMEFDEKQIFPEEIFAKFGELGFMGILVPEKYNGSGLGYTEYAMIIEEIAKVDPAIALSVAAHNGLCTNHINLFANEKQKQKYLPKLVSGKSIGAWALTEPNSGSDAAALRTKAIKSGNKYLLNGTKNFITHGSVGEICVVMAITDESKKSKGISAFIVEKGTTGFSAAKKENKLGMRASETCQLILDNCEIPEENLIGIEGEGFSQAMKVLTGGRISIAALSTGLAEGCLQNAINYSKERKQFDKSLSEFQGIQFKLAEMATEIEAAKLLVYKAASDKDAGKSEFNSPPMAKLFASEIAEKAASNAIQIFGGYGYMKDYPVEKFYRDVKLLTIGEGTSEVNKIVIAKNLLKD